MKATTFILTTITATGIHYGLTNTLAHEAQNPSATPVLATPPTPPPSYLTPAAVKRQPKIQLAILLDTSSSMSGLIDQARAELWKVVNEFATATQNGQRPTLEVSLYEYGNSNLESGEGYLRQITAFTTDLDLVSQELFALTTNGGSEHCGQVIDAASTGLRWSDHNDDLKVVFIAGNEPFTQGPIDYRSACQSAVSRGIVVNTIHCGPDAQGIGGKWKDAALLADGRYLNIDHNQVAVHIPAPQDEEIARLGRELNETYVPFGDIGRTSQERQNTQDDNAAAQSESSRVQRAVTKASAYYTNANWDLVDAVKTGKVDLDKIDAKDLPVPMQALDEAGRRNYIAEQAKNRADIQARINTLNNERREHIAKQRDQLANQDEDTLDSAMIKILRDQAAVKNYRFEAPDQPEQPNEQDTDEQTETRE